MGSSNVLISEEGHSPSGIADAVSDGHRLSVYLEPDTGLKGLANPKGRYIESYSLPHVCIEDGFFVGATRRTHFMHKPGHSGSQISAFFYTNVLPVYGIYSYASESDAANANSMSGRILNTAQYKVLRFMLHPAGNAVWSSEEPHDADQLKDAISSGRSLYILFSDENGIRRSHPLDLAFIFPDTGLIEFRVEHALLPEMFESPISFREKMYRSAPDLDSALTNSTVALSTRFRIFSAFRCIDQAGAAYSVNDIHADRRHRCTEVRVFALP